VNKNLFHLSKTPVIYGTGLIALDVVIGLEPNSTKQVYAGGTCGNVLTIMSYLGWESHPIARMGSDPAARFIRADFKKWHVCMDLISLKPSGDTPIIIERITRTSKGYPTHRFSWTCPNCGAWLPGYKPVLASSIHKKCENLRKITVLFFDRLSRGSVDLAKACFDKGALVCFEPSGISEPRLFDEVLKYVHILKYSNERMGEMSNAIFPDGPRLIIETLGAQGLRYRSSLCSSDIGTWNGMSSYKIDKLVDSAGAGDWCTAGILHCLAVNGLKGFLSANDESVRAAMNFGQAMAAWNCQFEGARGGMYKVSKKVFKNQINHIIFGEKLANNNETVEITNCVMLKCLGRACSTKRQKLKLPLKK